MAALLACGALLRSFVLEPFQVLFSALGLLFHRSDSLEGTFFVHSFSESVCPDLCESFNSLFVRSVIEPEFYWEIVIGVIGWYDAAIYLEDLCLAFPGRIVFAYVIDLPNDTVLE